MNNKKGFSFIEVLVVISVLLLALPAFFSIIFIILQEQTKLYRLSVVKREGDFAISTISNTIRNSASRIYNSVDVTSGNPVSCDSLGPTQRDDTTLLCNAAATDSTGYAPERICFVDKYGSGIPFNYYLTSNNISSASGNLSQPALLLSSKMYVKNFSVSCSRSGDFNTPIVKVTFDLCYNTGQADPCVSSRPEETATLHYQTNIKLTSY